VQRQVKQQHILASIDRADFNGFYDYVLAHSKYRPGVYSAVVVWNSVFGGNSASPGSPGYIPNTDEWTYEPETTNYKGNFPTGFCLKSGAVRAVLRRRHPVEQPRPHVAVVRRRRADQRDRRLQRRPRPDRRRAPPLA
jgi:hypothetical protein